MSDPTHKKVEVVGTSKESYAKATQNAIEKASETLHNLEWFEVGRTEWLRDRALPYREVESRGIALPLVEANLRIRSPARYDEVLDIEATLSEIRSRKVVFGYRILVEGRCVAEGVTVHAPVEAATGKSLRLPDWLVSMLRGDSEGRR